MKLVSLAIGWVLVAVACAIGYRSSRLEHELRDHEVAHVDTNSWPRQSLRAYRTKGWPLLLRLRRRVTAIYVIAIVGALFVMYGCPAVHL